MGFKLKLFGCSMLIISVSSVISLTGKTDLWSEFWLIANYFAIPAWTVLISTDKE